MLNDKIHTRPGFFYITNIEKIRVIFTLSEADDLIKSISENNIFLFMLASMNEYIYYEYFIEFTFCLTRLDNSWGTPIFSLIIRYSLFFG